MTKTTKIVLISSASVISSALISTVSYFKGRKDGYRIAMQQSNGTLPASDKAQQPNAQQTARA